MTLRGQRTGHHWDESYSKESFLPDKPTSWLKYYKAPSRLKQALPFPEKFPFLFDKVTYYFNFENDISPKNREIGSLVVRPWKKFKNCETHGRIVRFGRFVSPPAMWYPLCRYQFHSIGLSAIFGTHRKGTRNAKRSVKKEIESKRVGISHFRLYIFLVNGHTLILIFSFEFLSKRTYTDTP